MKKRIIHLAVHSAMTNVWNLPEIPVSGPITDETGKMEGFAQGFIKLKKKIGRPKKDGRRIAVALAKRLLTQFKYKSGEANQLIADWLSYSDSKKVRDVLGHPRTKELMSMPGSSVFLLENELGVEKSIIALFDSRDSMNETKEGFQLDGPGWLWTPGQQEAAYGKLTGKASY